MRLTRFYIQAGTPELGPTYQLYPGVGGGSGEFSPATGCGRSRPPTLDPTAYRSALLTSVLIMDGASDGASGVRRR
jgi:hypothetical protein